MFPVPKDGSFHIWLPAGNHGVFVRPSDKKSVDPGTLKTDGVTPVGSVVIRY
jgi:hypothetical protein